MKYYELTKEEQEMIDDIESGKFVSVKNLAEEKWQAILAARNTLKKTRNINIRVSEKVLHKIKAKAAENGIPYQTLVSSVLHRFANKEE